MLTKEYKHVEINLNKNNKILSLCLIEAHSINQLYNNMNIIKKLSYSLSDIIQYQQGTNTIRLSKLLSLKSLCSRRQAEEFISLGLVRVDGKRIFSNMLVPYQSDLRAMTPLGVHVDKPITKLWMMNKPRGYICTHRDPQKRKTIYELFPPQLIRMYGHLMSIGRLDFNSEGLLLITNDNILKGLLENPEAGLQRVYRVKVHGRVTEQKMVKMNQVHNIKGIPYGPLSASVDRQLSTNSWLNVSMKTGKNRQIRRIMQKCDLQVNKLIRTQYGPYRLGNLAHGEIAEIPLSKGLERKMKVNKAKQISGRGLSGCLIEVDIREKAIGVARAELESKPKQNQLQHIKNNQSLPNEDWDVQEIEQQ